MHNQRKWVIVKQQCSNISAGQETTSPPLGFISHTLYVGVTTAVIFSIQCFRLCGFFAAASMFGGSQFTAFPFVSQPAGDSDGKHYHLQQIQNSPMLSWTVRRELRIFNQVVVFLHHDHQRARSHWPLHVVKSCTGDFSVKVTVNEADGSRWQWKNLVFLATVWFWCYTWVKLRCAACPTHHPTADSSSFCFRPPPPLSQIVADVRKWKKTK